MWYVKLVNVKMCAKIGVYAQEQILGNDFLINVAIGFEGEKIMQLQQTIDYCMLYEIVAAQMQKPTPLLEEVISNIVEIFEKELSPWGVNMRSTHYRKKALLLVLKFLFMIAEQPIDII